MPQQYLVREQDCMASIAVRFGFHPDTIWNYGGNDDLRRVRGDSRILRAGDEVVIPLTFRTLFRPSEAIFEEPA